MSLSRSLQSTIVGAAALWSSVAALPCTSWDSVYPDAAHKSVDALIIGGGSSGSNAAINLLDAGLSVLIVEKMGQLGGMVNSWTDPSTGTVYDYGVATYTNNTGTLEFFERLGLDVTTPTFATTVPYYADFTTGETIDYVAPDWTSESAALGRYYNVTSEYQDLFYPSYANWPAPEDIPEDLLMSFGDFAVKYDLNDTMLLLWAGIGAGLADMLDLPTLYVMQTFGARTAGVFLGTEVQYVPSTLRNQDIYDAVASILGSDSLLLNSTAVASTRSADNQGVEVVVQNQVTGEYTIVSASRLVIAIEPTSDNMAAFNLDAKESALFDDATWSVVHTGIVSHPSLPDEALIYNLPASAAGGNDFAYPEPPFVDYFEYMGPGMYQTIVVGWEDITVEEAQTLANEALQKLADAGTIDATNGTELTIQAWSNHGAMDMRTSAENLQDGYIQNLYSLQGYRSTYWTGAAFSNQLSTYLWAYNLEYLCPLVVESLSTSS
ncbi:amine oxidase flavin-containing superfamily [Xylariales sp. PMI_506]|nr:amine oxidase flavin-containing superfamily [Xylariales sp. PMI_506]